MLRFLVFMMSTFITAKPPPGAAAGAAAAGAAAAASAAAATAAAAASSSSDAVVDASVAAAAYEAQLESMRQALRASKFRNTKLSWELSETRRKYESRCAIGSEGRCSR